MNKLNKSNVTKKHELPRFYSAGIKKFKLFRSDSDIFQAIKRNQIKILHFAKLGTLFFDSFIAFCLPIIKDRI